MRKLLQASKITLTIGSIFLAAASYAGEYAIEPISADDVQPSAVLGKHDFENGKFLFTRWNENTQTSTIEIYDSNTSTSLIISDNTAIKGDLGFANGVAFWTENAFEGEGDGIEKELFKYENGVVTQLTNNGFHKDGFTYSDGKVAWFQKESANVAPFTDYNLYVYDGQAVVQATDDGAAVRKFDNNYKTIQMDGGEVVFTAESGVYYWNGLETTKVTPDTHRVDFADIDSGVIVFTSRIESENYPQVYKLENGQISALTSGPLPPTTSYYGNSYQDIQIEDGIISWEVSDLGTQRSELYIHKNGVTTMIDDDMAWGRAVLADGNIYWKNGPGQVGSAVMAYDNGDITQVFSSGLITGLQASNGQVAMLDSYASQIWQLASPLVNTIDLGSEHSFTPVTVNGEITLTASQFSAWSFSPTYLEFGIDANDGETLDGVTVETEDGRIYDLSGGWERVPVDFTGNARNIKITVAGSKNLTVQWWATTEPNGIDLGTEHSSTDINLDKPVTLQVQQWSAWGWNPTKIGFGFSTADNMPLNGLEVRDTDGNTHWLHGDWANIDRPFYWQPVKLIIPAQDRAIRVQWWATGH